jgi:hypothetical protein
MGSCSKSPCACGAQGHHFGRPVPVAGFDAVLKARLAPERRAGRRSF